MKKNPATAASNITAIAAPIPTPAAAPADRPPPLLSEVLIGCGGVLVSDARFEVELEAAPVSDDELVTRSEL
jgi:hypothetical protein